MQIPSTSSYGSSKPNGAIILHTPDEALIDAIVDGDKSALRELYGRHRESLTRYLTRLTRKPTLAEEIVNEVFLAVWQHADEFQGRSRVSTWLVGIARHKAISAFRRRQEVQLDDGFAMTIEDPSDNAAATMDKQDRRKVLHQCLAKLPPAQREVIELFYYQDEPIEAVARRTGAPLNTVKSRMFYARTRMAELLNEAGVDRAWLR
jgi:RNA polymerase sigma-70 factor (ECF subfamily)